MNETLSVTEPPQYWTYILTNWKKTVLYVGSTDDLNGMLVENWIGSEGGFTTRYHVYYLAWYEGAKTMEAAQAREQEIKGMAKTKKDELIGLQNPKRRILNKEVLGNWPPNNAQTVAARRRWRDELAAEQDDDTDEYDNHSPSSTDNKAIHS